MSIAGIAHEARLAPLEPSDRAILLDDFTDFELNFVAIVPMRPQSESVGRLQLPQHADVLQLNRDGKALLRPL